MVPLCTLAAKVITVAAAAAVQYVNEFKLIGIIKKKSGGIIKNENCSKKNFFFRRKKKKIKGKETVLIIS